MLPWIVPPRHFSGLPPARTLSKAAEVDPASDVAHSWLRQVSVTVPEPAARPPQTLRDLPQAALPVRLASASYQCVGDPSGRRYVGPGPASVTVWISVSCFSSTEMPSPGLSLGHT